MTWEIVFIAGAAFLLLAAFWVADRFRRWRHDRAYLMREVSELSAHALVLQDHSPQAIVKFETTGLIRTVNPVAEELFGYPAGELLGHHIAQLVPGALSASRLTETLEIRRKDGSRARFPFKATKSDLVPVSYIYLFFDCQLQAQPQPPPQPPLSYAARIVGRVAHQFETLLTTINGYSELALTETPDGSPLRQEIQEIITASHRASSLTRHLVAFSGGQFLPVEPVNLTHLVQEMTAQLRQTVPCPIDFDLQPVNAALANMDCLREVILLLCGSARGRLRDTDRLRLQTRQCDLKAPLLVQSGELKAGMYGALSISDSGRPINAQVKERLFEPLDLLHEHMGVDLSSIYGVVRSLGGGINVKTGDNIGTTFEILLPCVNSVQPASA